MVAAMWCQAERLISSGSGLRVIGGDHAVAQLQQRRPAVHVGGVAFAALVFEDANQLVQLGHAAAIARRSALLCAARARVDQDLEIVHAAEQILLGLQAVQAGGRSRHASARAESRARSAASWLRCGRDAGDRRDRCRRRARWRPSGCGRAAPTAWPLRSGRCAARACRGSGAATWTSRLRSLSRRDGVISSSISRRRFCRSSITALRTRAMARFGAAPLPSSSASNSNVTSSSRTGPSARVMRRTRRLRAIERARRRRARPAPAALRAIGATRRAPGARRFRRPPAPRAWPAATRRGVGEAARRRGPNAPC